MCVEHSTLSIPLPSLQISVNLRVFLIPSWQTRVQLYFGDKLFNSFQNLTSLLTAPMFTTAELWRLQRMSVWYCQVGMKALTSYCIAEQPVSNGLHNNCSTSLTFSIYTRSNSLFCWKHLCLISDKINMSVLIYCFLFFHYQKQAINNWHVWLFAVCRSCRHKDREENNVLIETKNYTMTDCLLGIDMDMSYARVVRTASLTSYPVRCKM
jgi:hypothetical protein